MMAVKDEAARKASDRRVAGVKGGDVGLGPASGAASGRFGEHSLRYLVEEAADSL
jgi:hypothetical protein